MRPPNGVRRHIINLGVRFFPGKHDGDTVIKKVNEMLGEFGIDCGSEVLSVLEGEHHDLDELAAEPLKSDEEGKEDQRDVDSDSDDDDATSGGGAAAAAASAAEE